MYRDRTAWRCTFFVGKNMDAAKDIDKEMLPIWTIGKLTLSDIAQVPLQMKVFLI
jgi:hypothetical protein